MEDLEVKLAEVSDQENVDAIEGQLASMSQQAVEQVERHLDGQPNLTSDDVQHEIDRANAAEDAMIDAQHLRHEQDAHIASGDLRGAQDLAQAREYELTIADDQGASVDRPWVQAQQDVAALSWGAHEQSIADDHAVSAASYAAAGDDDNASAYADRADDHAETATAYADAASDDDAADSDDSSQVDTTQTEG